jgi:hypothetical protein
MSRPRILMAVTPQLLRDAIEIALIARQLKPVVMKEEYDSIDVLVRARQHKAEVVVVTLDSASGIPPMVTHLLDLFPKTRVVGIDMRAARAAVYRVSGDRMKVRLLREFSMSAISRAIIGRTGKSSH